MWKRCKQAHGSRTLTWKGENQCPDGQEEDGYYKGRVGPPSRGTPKEAIGLEIHYGELRFLSGKLEEWEGSSERGQAFTMTG